MIANNGRVFFFCQDDHLKRENSACARPAGDMPFARAQ